MRDQKFESFELEGIRVYKTVYRLEFIPMPKLLIKNHKLVLDNKLYPTCIVVLVSNFGWAFLEVGYKRNQENFGCLYSGV